MNKKTEFIPRPQRTVEEKRAYRLERYHEGRKAIKQRDIAIEVLKFYAWKESNKDNSPAREALKEIEEIG